MKIILASASSRRQELLNRLIEDFKIIVSDFDENSVEFKGDCGSYVMELAEGKALDVCNKVKEEAIVIGCDTIVSYKDTILGKPQDEKEAFNMLKLLSGNIHQVYSGIAVVNNSSGKIIREFVCTDVKFDKLSDMQIEKYIEKGEYADKAGAYGIQGYGGIFVEEIHGCYYNVVGLPLNKLSKMLKEMGVNL
ncbi:Maf-like protein [Clostridium sp. A1-XYC3]|uniref:dTTP/UTP pyrophosphatase n=1 Tax=Clostridium tanneri TaxID=3037988 RepID=A0ABU4JP01_9CLOT|nr:Maf-like protein [Clostridium sp. A1-XYC3]MDW8799869.1 Maf-like protein [Clostridium sp. A1-XYC3]